MRARTSSPVFFSALALGVLFLTVMLLVNRSQKGIAVGWCCVRAGAACNGGYDALICRDSGGIAFSTAESSCAMACSLSVAHATQNQ